MLPFKLKGILIGVDTGFVEVGLIGPNKEMRNINFTSSKVPIRGGIVDLNGEMEYPHAIVLIIRLGTKHIASDIFFISPGSQLFECRVDTIKNKPLKIENTPISIEYFTKYLSSEYVSIQDKFYSNFNVSESIPIQADSLKIKRERLVKEYKEAINKYNLEYVKENPDSYIGLWQIINSYWTGGYSPKIDSAYYLLSKDIKETKTGSYLQNSLESSRNLSVGKKFPNSIFRTISNAKDSIYVPGTKQFYLIDFWFSNCAPCLKEFPHLKKIYKKYKHRGFEVIAISTDRLERKKNWIDVIQKNKLDFIHLWDRDAVFSSKYFIYSFPTNYLLDSNGKIIYKNIKPDELEIFLSKSFN